MGEDECDQDRTKKICAQFDFSGLRTPQEELNKIETNIIRPRGKPYTDADILDYVDKQRKKAESHFLEKNGICIDSF